MFDLTTIKNDDEILQPFFQLNPEFDLLSFDFSNQAAVDALNWQDLDKKTIIQRLQEYKKLIGKGWTAQEAKQLLNASAPPAGDISPGSFQIVANTLQVSSPRLENKSFNNTNQLQRHFQQLPSYQKIFGSLDYLQCDPCQSIFSPAAYFVDLMRIVEQYITQPNQNNPGFEGLQQRRPDLEQIPLTCDNTNDKVFYTEIVNEVLTEKLQKAVGEEIFRHLATAKYPQSLPFNVHLEQTRTYLSHLKTNLADIYQTLHPQQPYSTIWAREYLGLSPEEYQLITTANATAEDLKTHYGIDSQVEQGEDFWGLAKKETFLKSTKLSWQELNDLLYQNLSPAEIENGLAHQFFINRSLSGTLYLNLKNGTIENLDLGTLDRVDRFLRLARKIGWSFADLDWVLASIGVTEINEDAIVKIAKIKHLQTQTKLPLDVLCSFWHEMKTYGKGDSAKRPQDLFDRVFNNYFTVQGQDAWQPNPNPVISWQIDDPNESNLVLEERLLAALQLSDPDLTEIAEGIWGEGNQVILNLANLSRLYRNAQVLKLLGLKTKEYQLLLKFRGASWQSPEQLEVDTLIEIVKLAQWLKVSGFNVYELDYILSGTEYPSVKVFLPNQNMAAAMESLWATIQLSTEDLTDEKTVNELNEKVANHFGIEPGLFSILATVGANAQTSADYLQLLLTKVDTTGDDWSKIVQCLQLISRLYGMANKLALTEVELRSIQELPQAYNLDSLAELTVANIQTLYKFKQQLVGSFNQSEENLLEYLKQSQGSDESSILDGLAALTGWNRKQIDRGIAYLQEANLYQSVEGLLKLKQCFDLCATLGCNLDFLCQLSDLSKNGSAEANWTNYENLAQSVTSVVQAKYDEAEWTKVFEKLNGSGEESKCQILREFALHQLKLENLRQLSEYLLLDVEMTSCACNSPIQLAILSVQTYLQRCRMGFEPGVTKVEIPEVWWEWIPNYRKWEANRKVFLYPENYIDPSLRKDASPIFKELQNELLQSEITAESVENVYRNYFDKFAEITSLQIFEGCRCFMISPKSSNFIDTLFLFAKTITEPRTFYYRHCEYPEAKKPLWGYWQKIDLQINSDYLASVYAFDRLFIFWVETKKIKKSQQEPETTQATVKYSFLNASQKWVLPQTVVADVEIPQNFDVDVDNSFWQQVYPRVVLDKKSQSNVLEVVFGGLQHISLNGFNSEQIKLLSARFKIKNERNEFKILQSVIARDLLHIDMSEEFLKKINHYSLELPEARSNLAAATVGNLVLFAGANTSKGYYKSTNSVDVFALNQGELEKQPTLQLSLVRERLVATKVGNLVVFTGGTGVEPGDSHYSPSKRVDVFALNQGELEKQLTTPELSEGRMGLAIATVGNLVLVAGGRSMNGLSKRIDVFVNKNGKLEKMPTTLELSEAREHLAAATVGNLVVFAGGSSFQEGETVDSKTIDVFVNNNGNLERVSTTLELSEARRELSAATVGNLVVFGGWGRKIDVFVNKNDNLERVPTTIELSETRYGITVATVGNLVFFAGGFYSGSGVSKKIDVFVNKNDNLERVPTTIELSEARSDLGAATVGNLVVFAGGKITTYLTKTIDIFSVSQLPVKTLPSVKDKLPDETTVSLIKNQKQGFIFQRRSEAFSYLGQEFPLTRLTTSTIQDFNHTLFTKGLDGLLSLKSQLSPEPDFADLTNKRLDFDGAYGVYFWEIFFHIPFLLASTLNANQRYNEARKWYQYIFNPGQSLPQLPNLTASWPLNDNQSIIKDENGGNDGTVENDGTWEEVTDFPGSTSRYVLNFNGSTYVKTLRTAEQLKLTNNSFTIEAWVKADDLPQRPAKLEDQYQDKNRDLAILSTTYKDGRYNLSRTNEVFHFIIRYDTVILGFWDNDLIGKTKLQKDVWYQIVVRYNKFTQEQAIFINGRLDASRTNASAFKGLEGSEGESHVYIGRYEDFLGEHFFQGHIANVRIWDRPLSNEEILESSDSKNYFWRFLPFRGHTPEQLKENLINTSAIQAYKENPFDPYKIANLRIGAYEKAVVMKYIDNLLDWGDALFTQDNWESITQATTLYLLAYDLLGEKPKNLGSPPAQPPKTFAEIKAGPKSDMAEFLLNLLENRPEYQEFIQQFGDAVPFNALDAYFCISENQEFAQYWDRVEDRLFKIRHCQSIKGIERQLALFSPPIDPRQLVRQAAAGDGSIALSIADEIPHYRFSYLLERAKGMVSTVIQLGSTLLSTLEKKDAEELAALQATQESILLELITKTKKKQIEEAQCNKESLDKSKSAAEARETHYQNLIDEGFSDWENVAVVLMTGALASYLQSVIVRIPAIPAHFLPTIVGTSNGGAAPGEAFEATADVVDGIADIFNQSASIILTRAEFQRREEDWKLQKTMADWDKKQIQDQIAAADVRIELAKAELDVHNKSIEHSRQVEQFYKDKFTNKDLYQWMVGRLSGLYFQTYKIALDMANSAQKAYQYELNKDDTYIQSIYWDSNKKGLLAGESLMLGLNQLEKAYLDGNERRLEIEKVISLRQLDPHAFLNLIQNGSCTFNFDEKLFALDFPSHYCRQIKTISVSIPAEAGSYQNINATFTQTSNKVLIKPDANAVKWLLTGEGNEPDTGTLRQNWRQYQQIAISKGTNDNGLFVLNFQDERYLPFEGTGAISSWELKLPKASNSIDFASITDVIITVSYTAIEGGSTISQAVADNFGPFTGKVVLNLRQELLDNSNPQSLSFTVSPQLFRTNLKGYKLSKIDLLAFPSSGDLPSTLDLQIPSQSPITLNKENDMYTTSTAVENYDTSVSEWVLHDPNGLFDPQKLTDLVLMVDYEGEIDWS